MTTTRQDATNAYAAAAADIQRMAATIQECDWTIDCREADWNDAGNLAEACRHMVTAMYHLGAITEVQAAEMGVTL
jgi:hypothetical protein